MPRNWPVRSLLGALCIVLAIVLAVVILSPPPRPAQSADPPAVVQAHAGDEEGTENWLVLGLRLKITDVLMVAFTFGLFVATAALWWATKALVSEGRNTAKAQLRAYVTVVSVDFLCGATPSSGAADLHRELRVGAWPQARLKIRNSGVTPAYRLGGWTRIAFVDWPIVADPDIDPHSPAHRQPLGPGIETDLAVTCGEGAPAISLEDRTGLADGSRVLMACGVLDYTDAFGAARHVRFRAYVGGDTPRALGPGFFHRDGNDVT
jgi:hypothetical protein